jgi:hypothetical protein
MVLLPCIAPKRARFRAPVFDLSPGPIHCSFVAFDFWRHHEAVSPLRSSAAGSLSNFLLPVFSFHFATPGSLPLDSHVDSFIPTGFLRS